MGDVNLHITLPKRFNVFSTLSSPWKWLSQGLVTLLEASHCTCWSAHPLLAIILWSVKTTSCFYFHDLSSSLRPDRHRTATTQMNDEGNQRTMDFEEQVVTISPSPATERNPQHRAVQESPVTPPSSLVECQGYEPDGNLCQLLWKFHRTEIVSGDTILKARKVQKYL